jgi:glc operon protein GlcG
MRANASLLGVICASCMMISTALGQQPSPPASGGPPSALPFGMPVTLGQAMKAADAAVAQAGKTNSKLAIAIVEPSGELVYFRKMDGAPYSATQLAQDKAITAARFRRPSRAFQDQIARGNQYFLTFGVIAAPGGLVLEADGKIVGAIGVSGGTGDEDEEVARAGVAALK